MIMSNKVEFDLTIKKYGRKDERQPYYPESGEKEAKLELQESLNFKSLSAVEVIRKLLDYIS